MEPTDVQALVEEGTFQYTIGESAEAVRTLLRAVQADPRSFEAWHALAEVHFAGRDLAAALEAAQRAHALRPDDLFINTTLSRIWMERGDKAAAERHGARAKVLGWKDQLHGNSEASEPPFTAQPFAS